MVAEMEPGGYDRDEVMLLLARGTTLSLALAKIVLRVESLLTPTETMEYTLTK